MKRSKNITMSLMLVLLSQMVWASSSSVMAIIAHHDLPHRHLSKTEVNLIFWRKKLFWGNGERIQPVNLPANHPMRDQFSNLVMGVATDSQSDYWNELYYHGVKPPHVVQSPEGVLRYVSDTPGAIGYVNACLVDSRVKVLGWMDEAGNFQNQMPSLDCEHHAP